MSFRWAILGAGSIAGKFADAVSRSSDGVVAAVASRSAQRAAAFAASHGIPASYGDYARCSGKSAPTRPTSL